MVVGLSNATTGDDGISVEKHPLARIHAADASACPYETGRSAALARMRSTQRAVFLRVIRVHVPLAQTARSFCAWPRASPGSPQSFCEIGPEAGKTALLERMVSWLARALRDSLAVQMIATKHSSSHEYRPAPQLLAAGRSPQATVGEVEAIAKSLKGRRHDGF